MNTTRTLRARFALWVTALILLFLAAFGGLVYAFLSHSMHRAVDASLVLGAEQLYAGLWEEDGSLVMPPASASAPDLAEFSAFSQRGVTLAVLSLSGDALQAIGPASASLPATARPRAQPELRNFPEADAPQMRIRVYTLPIVVDGRLVGWVQAIQSLESVEVLLRTLRVAILLGCALLSLLAGFAGYFLAGRALAPIDQMAVTARRITTEDLSARLNLPDTGDELSRLAGALDEMLARIEAGFTRQRQFTADASHELRTPLAAMLAILSVVREGERPAQEYRQALDDLQQEAGRLQQIVDDLLQLARGERGLEQRREEVDLALLLADVADALRPLAEAKRVTLRCDLPASLIITGDSDLLIRLVVNLLDNAIKYTEQGAVTLRARREEGFAVIQVSDTGIGIPPEHLARVFDRFYRVESARSLGGAGLGLSIAQQIVLAHGGQIEARSTPGAGTVFVVQLPL